jgi:lipoyl synthase
MHGFALNLDPDMAYFGRMNPCGITDRPVTSVRAGRSPVSLEEAVEALVPRFARVFDAPDPEVQLGAFVPGPGPGAGVRGRPPPRRGHLLGREADRTSRCSIGGRLPGEPERPEWMKVTARMDADYRDLKKLMRGLELHTVCEEAGCPNIYECWGMGTATLMILGDKCTRACGFCNVTTGRPTEFDVMEPFRAAEAIKR